MSAKRNAPGATGALKNQLDGGSELIVTHLPGTARQAGAEPQETLLVDCPHCGKFHLHAGGNVDRVRLGERRARCSQVPLCNSLHKPPVGSLDFRQAVTR
jgi:hypothetical protein